MLVHDKNLLHNFLQHLLINNNALIRQTNAQIHGKIESIPSVSVHSNKANYFVFH